MNNNNENLYQYLLILGDQSMILGHRLSELCGHGPSLETDIACTNISLDLFGEVRSYFHYAATIKGGKKSEDSVAYLRNERQYRNPILVEQPNTHFGYVIARQYLYDVYHYMLLGKLMHVGDQRIREIAAKSIKEAKYHKSFSGDWVMRLGLGTEESHQKIQVAFNDLYPYCHELVKSSQVEKIAAEHGYGIDVNNLAEDYYFEIHQLLQDASIDYDKESKRYAKGKEGIHTEYMGHILGDFQYMQRTYPDLVW